MNQDFQSGQNPPGRSFSRLGDDTPDQFFYRRPQSNSDGKKKVELILGMAGNQPCAFLTSQVYNIIQPGPYGLEVINQPDPEQGPLWGKINYRGENLKVIELPRVLNLPLVEPISRCQILLSGKLRPDGVSQETYGVAIEDLLAVKFFSLDDIRLLPRWLVRHLKGLLWGAVLVERDALIYEGFMVGGQSEAILQPVRFEDFSPGFKPDEEAIVPPPASFNTPEPEVPPVDTLPAFDRNSTWLDVWQIEKPAASHVSIKHEKTLGKAGIIPEEGKDTRRPVMIVDLDVLRRLIYRGSAG